MKIKPRLYAQALVSVLQETKSETEQKLVLHNFVQLLAEHKQLREWPRIARLVERQHQLITGQAVAEVRTATDLSKTQLTQLTDFLRQQLHLQHLSVQVQPAPELLAGLTVRVRDHFYDLSLRHQLQQYLHKFTN